MKQIYLDNAATSPIRPEVVAAMVECYSDVIGNASSLHTIGQSAKRALEGARATVAAAIGASPKEIYFTSGGTVSDNMALRGVALARRDRGRHLVTSGIEHHAVLSTCHQLEREGYRVTYLPVDNGGLVNLAALRSCIQDDTILISVMLANNEVGTIQPFAEISAIARERGVLLHTDAVQAMGKVPVDVDDLGVDLLSFTAHKLYGPKGVGVLYVRQGTPIVPLVYGGHQERELWPGTENIQGIVGLATALELAGEEMGSEPARLAGLRDRLQSGILKRIPDANLNGHPSSRLPNILNVSFANAEGESLLLALDTKGIAVSTGSACSAGSTDPSHVLMTMGVPRELAQGSLRFSLGRENTEEDIAYVLEALVGIVERLRELSPV